MELCMSPNGNDEDYSRRTFMGAFAGGAMGLAVGAPQAIDAVKRHQSIVDMAILELNMRGMTLNGKGVARSLDTNKDGNKDVEVTRTDAKDRDDVIQITSNETKTGDYAFSVANVQSRGLTLGDLTDEDTTYEYAEGENNTSTVPDEVWLVIKPDSSGKGKKGKSNGRQYICRTESAASADDWPTRDVGSEIEGDFSGEPNPGSGQEWKKFIQGKNELKRLGDNLIEEFSEDATVQGVGVGRGTTTTSDSEINTYFDNLVVAGEDTELPD